MSAYRANEELIRQSGVVRTHSGRPRSDYFDNNVPTFKSSIFVPYETKKGVWRYKNVGVCTPEQTNQLMAAGDGRRLAAQYNIPYDPRHGSLHNKLKSEVFQNVESVLTPVECVRPPLLGRVLQLRRSGATPVSPVVDVIEPESVVLEPEPMRAWIVIQNLVEYHEGKARSGNNWRVVSEGSGIGKLFMDHDAAETRRDELNEEFYGDNRNPKRFNLDFEHTFRYHWPEHIGRGIKKTEEEIDWADALLIGTWRDPFTMMELRDKLPED